ncbi:hypothetical protein [Cupriavidus sp. IDO]|uniref:hypothetical protein n=1 Tax=Cupriavidus sp. IDO TaxID=1539142 RepID=UPI0005793DD1|nr:hypothetical protein [Cupriavidus sp. IDO]KWR90886.1 hypothetical protein RM96_07120 [Cupriavidus sp. IDO]
MKRTLVALSVALTVLTPVAAHAQFSVSSLMGGKSSSGGADLTAQNDELLRGYVAASKDVLTAQSKMADALGMKDEAVKLQASADTVSNGATKDNLADADKLLTDTAKAVAEKLKANPALGEKEKATFVAGLASLGSGMVKYVGLKDKLASFKNAVTTASPLALTKLGTGVYIVKSLPDSVTTMGGALSNAISYAKGRDIPVPADATKALSNLSLS